MRAKITAVLLCVGVVVFIFAGCSAKLQKTAETSAGASPGSSVDVTVVTGLVSTIGDDLITLELVKVNDAGSRDEVFSVDTVSYIKAGGTCLVTNHQDTSVILAAGGYALGSLKDVAVGDFLAVTFRNDVAVTIIDAGPPDASGSAAANGDENEAVQADTGSDSTVPGKGVPDSGEPAIYTVTTDNLKVRSGPGTTYSVQGLLDTGARVTGTVSGGWLTFTYGGKTAYCSAEYLAISEEPEGVPDTSESRTYTTTSNVLARSGPGTTYTILGTIEKGAQLTGAVTNGWVKFAYGKKDAYCSAAYLTAS
jgi:uncharacterized protein YgiM (DUF1202 family)